MFGFFFFFSSSFFSFSCDGRAGGGGSGVGMRPGRVPCAAAIMGAMAGARACHSRGGGHAARQVPVACRTTFLLGHGGCVQ